MALPSVYTLDIIENAEAALALIITGADYRHTIETIANESEAVDVVKAAITPWLYVEMRDESEELLLGRRGENEAEMTVRGYVYKDDVRFPNLTIRQILEHVLSDVKKALDIDVTRGRNCTSRILRKVNRFIDIEGVYAAFLLTDTLKLKRNL